jgi:peptide/nickel transport system substrate-binding protein
MRLRSLVALALLGMAALASPVAAATVTIALGAEPSSLDPQLVQDGSERSVNDNIYETLVYKQADGTLVPGLAAAMPEQVAPDRWRFHLRPGIKFTDGEPFDSAAVVASVARILDPAFKSRQATWFSAILRGEAVDPLTVDIVTKQPDPTLPARMYWMKMVPPEASKQPDFALHPVGTGPYRFVEWVRGQRVVLAADPSYWGGKPAIDGVTFRFVPEPGTRLAGLKSGQFDLITALLPEYAKQVPQMVHVGGPEVGLMVLNTRPGAGITEDVRVRRALTLAIDRASMAKDLFEGYAEPASDQIVGRGWTGYDPSLKPTPYDPAEAARLIKEAGATGKTLDVLAVSGRWLKDREQVETVAAYWEAAGLKVNLHFLEWTEYLNRLFDQTTRPQVAFVVHGNPLFDADRTYTAYLEAGKGSMSSSTRPDLDAFIARARTETDPQKRDALYAQISEAAAKDYLYVFLLQAEDLYGLSARLRWQPRTDGKLIVKEMRVAE